MEPFASVPEQHEAKRLLSAALADGGAHAYVLHGPPGVGKRSAALAFAGALLGDERRAAERTHPDLYVLEPLGEMIRIDDVRALRRDLHMRPVRGGPPRVPDPRRGSHERGRRRRAAQGPRGAAAVRDDRAGRERARPPSGDHPLALSAGAVPTALGAGRARVDRQSSRPTGTRTRCARSHVLRREGSTARGDFSTLPHPRDARA